MIIIGGSQFPDDVRTSINTLAGTVSSGKILVADGGGSLTVDGAVTVSGTVTANDGAGIKIFDTRTSTYKGLQFNAEAPQVCAQDYLMAMSEGDITGHTTFAKFGVATGVQNTSVDVTEMSVAYVFPNTAGEQMRVVSSSTSDDGSPAGVGAQKIKIEYLDQNNATQTEEVTLDGTTPVNTVSTKIRRVQKVWVSLGAAAVGNITVYHLTNATPIYAQISATKTQSRQLVYTVPAGKTLYITDVNLSTGVGNSTSSNKQNYVVFTTRATVDPGTGAVSSLFYPYNEIGLINNSYHLDLKLPTKIPATADLKISVIGDTALAVTCQAAIRGWIE